MVPRGLEPRTLRLLAVRSDQLSYETCWQGHQRWRHCSTDARCKLLWPLRMPPWTNRVPGVAEREKVALARAIAHNVVPRGLEPRTLWLLAVRSNQLSYGGEAKN